MPGIFSLSYPRAEVPMPHPRTCSAAARKLIAQAANFVSGLRGLCFEPWQRLGRYTPATRA
eukprot:9512071-Karenia_brevis.AAC.1